MNSDLKLMNFWEIIIDRKNMLYTKKKLKWKLIKFKFLYNKQEIYANTIILCWEYNFYFNMTFIDIFVIIYDNI